jgi:hypothetical protein
MDENRTKSRYRPTESRYKGGAQEMYVTYDLQQKTRGGGQALYPKVKRVYIAGEVKDWKVARSASGQAGKFLVWQSSMSKTGKVTAGKALQPNAEKPNTRLHRRLSSRLHRNSGKWWRFPKKPSISTTTPHQTNCPKSIKVPCKIFGRAKRKKYFFKRSGAVAVG